MTVIKFLKDHSCCAAGIRFALQYENMDQVWDNCARDSWLFFMYGCAAEPLKNTSKISQRLIKAALDSLLDKRMHVFCSENGRYLFDLCATKIRKFLDDPHRKHPELSIADSDEDDMSESARCRDAGIAYQIAYEEKDALSAAGAYYLDKIATLLEATAVEHPLTLLSIVFTAGSPDFYTVDNSKWIRNLLPNPFIPTKITTTL